MAEARTTFRDGFRGSGIENAWASYDVVRIELALLGEALKLLVSSYVDLGESELARASFTNVSDRLGEGSLRLAADRARLLPYQLEKGSPEAPFETFLAILPSVRTRLETFESGDIPPIELEFRMTELIR